MKALFYVFFSLSFNYMTCQVNDLKNDLKVNHNSEVLKVQSFVEPIFKIYPTENAWALIKLDTRNGKLSQVHFTISREGYEGELFINATPLVEKDDEIVGRFTLQPTQNMYNFILLDQVNGKTYKVQWNNESDKRFIRRIY